MSKLTSISELVRRSLREIFQFSAENLLLLSVATGIALAQNPAPLISQPLVPDAIRPGSAGFTLTANGTGFVSGAVVKWNGNTRTTTIVSKSRVTAGCFLRFGSRILR